MQLFYKNIAVSKKLFCRWIEFHLGLHP